MSEPTDALASVQALADKLPEMPLRLKIGGSPVVLEKAWLLEVCAELDARRTDQAGEGAELDALRRVYGQLEVLYQQAAALGTNAVPAAELAAELHFILTGEEAEEHPPQMVEAMLLTLRRHNPNATREDAIAALDIMRGAAADLDPDEDVLENEIEVDEVEEEGPGPINQGKLLQAIYKDPIPVPRVSGAEILGRKADAHGRIDLGSIGS